MPMLKERVNIPLKAKKARMSVAKSNKSPKGSRNNAEYAGWGTFFVDNAIHREIDQPVPMRVFCWKNTVKRGIDISGI